LAALLEYCPEYSDIHRVERHVCSWFDCPKNEHGDYVPPDKQYPQWDHNAYRMLSDATTMAVDTELSSHHVHLGFSVFPHISCIVSNLPKPNLLHTMLIGMLDHHEKLIFHFMKTHEPLDKYIAIWLSDAGLPQPPTKN
jgi:hypothetical protein